jgi:type IV pilus assembly protein PilY1
LATSGVATPYRPGLSLTNNSDTAVYEVYIRVKVCDPIVGLETNCQKYTNGYKPEGLIQQYSKDIRYSVFGYLNDSSESRDGGVLRANQKFVGQALRVPNQTGEQANPQNEWDASTGVFIKNPNPTDASNTGAGVVDSGVINYLNKFGQMTSSDHKSLDPVSELYYSTIRYFKNQGKIAEYSTITGDNATKYRLADGFPVITSWNDPIQYSCQKNVILGIGDTNTHRDKNLPGPTNAEGEPAKPPQVSADTTVNVVTATKKVQDLESASSLGSVDLKTTSSAYTGRYNSAYIAGLAYDAHTKDLRSDLKGTQTLSTFWVDVRENESLAGRGSNQYWLAAKYGGFTVPSNYSPYERTAALPDAWWHTTTDMLATNYPRPDNFYVASDATKMVESLKAAFAKIAQEAAGTAAAVSISSSRLTTDSAIYQATLDSKYWSGDLQAQKVGADGTISTIATWSAAQKLDSLAENTLASRKIFTVTTPTADSTNGALRSVTGTNFLWSALDDSQRAALRRSTGTTTLTTETVAQNRLAYLRGSRIQEISETNTTNTFRRRGSRLGDIVNSDPQYVYKQDYGYSRLSGSLAAAGSRYAAFRNTSTYLSRTPLVVVGANDGMLHGFDATASESGGQELFAYVPNSVFTNLYRLTEPVYPHRYYVDGTPRVADAWLGSGGNQGWKTMVVGTTGAGGNSVFALDITNPGNMSASNVMWEFSHPAMGYSMGQAAVVALPNGKFGVVVTSGYSDGARNPAHVWILDAANGQVIKDFTLATTGGLGAPLVVDTNSDMIADRIYAADTLGNLWRLDMNSSEASSWGIPSTLSGSPLFIAKDSAGTRQSITAPLASAFNSKNQHMIFFGTGSYYLDTDNEIPTSPQVNTFYGIIDKGTAIDGQSTLNKQSILREVNVSGTLGRLISKNTMTDAQNGWYLDLVWTTANGGPGAKGERVISKPTLRSDRVVFSTMTPSSDPCAYGGTSWIMAIDLSSGSRFDYNYFDVNGDGLLDDKDAYQNLTPGSDATYLPLSGIDPGDGIVKSPTLPYRRLCYAGSSGGSPKCINVSGSQVYGRQSWREVR